MLSRCLNALSVWFIDCGRLDIEYGQFFTQGSTTFGATAYVFCNDGYVIREPDGEIETQCLDTAEWSIKPSCEPVGKLQTLSKYEICDGVSMSSN